MFQLLTHCLRFELTSLFWSTKGKLKSLPYCLFFNFFRFIKFYSTSFQMEIMQKISLIYWNQTIFCKTLGPEMKSLVQLHFLLQSATWLFIKLSCWDGKKNVLGQWIPWLLTLSINTQSFNTTYSSIWKTRKVSERHKLLLNTTRRQIFLFTLPTFRCRKTLWFQVPCKTMEKSKIARVFPEQNKCSSEIEGH